MKNRQELLFNSIYEISSELFLLTSDQYTINKRNQSFPQNFGTWIDLTYSAVLLYYFIQFNDKPLENIYPNFIESIGKKYFMVLLIFQF